MKPRKALAPSLAFLTLLLFGAAGVALIVLQERGLRAVLIGEGDVFFQIMLGSVGGILIAFLAWYIIALKFMAPVRSRYSRMIGPLMSRRSDRILVSICAGIGEELFFRGALQFWLGIVATAIIFVAIHGYLNPRNWRISLYGTFLTLAMVALGWAAMEFGLLAPMIAHAIIDIVLLERLHSEWKKDQRHFNPASTYADRNYPR